jgi:putative addiction module component (TIGR02574 family)
MDAAGAHASLAPGMTRSKNVRKGTKSDISRMSPALPSLKQLTEAEDYSMTAETQAILNAALALPEPERILLAEQLLEAISPDAESDTEEDFAAELDRRAAECEREPSCTIALADVLKED